MNKTIQEKIYIKYFLILFIIVNAAFILQKVILNVNKDVFTDDAYYYILTAINYVKHGFYTFDTINATNGFHPLLEWLETLLFLVVGVNHDPQWLYIVTLIFIGFLLLVFTVGLAIYALRALKNKKLKSSTSIYVFLALVSFLFWRYLGSYINGMESVLVIILVTVLSLSLLEERYFFTSIIAMFLVAARLDTLVYFIAPMFFIFSIYHAKEKKSYLYGFKFFLAILAPSILFTLIYMIYNYAMFDHLKPIHGALKSTFPHFHPQLFLIKTKTFIILFSVSLLGIVLALKEKYAKGGLRVLGISLGIITVIYILNFYLFQKWSKGIPSWYLSLLYFTSFGSLFIGAANIISLKYLKIFSFLSMVLLTVIAGKRTVVDIYKILQNKSIYTRTEAGTIDFIKTLPTKSMLAYTDTGKISFWSERNVINLDGLINNYEYQDYLHKKIFAQYLEDKNVDYLITGIWDRKQTKDREYEPMYKYRVDAAVYKGEYEFLSYYLYSYLYNNYSDKLKLYKCAEIYRSSGENYDGKALSRTIIYDLKKNKSCYKETLSYE